MYHNILFVAICCSYSMNFIKFVSKNSLDTPTSLSTFFSIDCFKLAVDSPCFIGISETVRQLRHKFWCKLSTSAESLSLVFWLSSSVGSRTTTLFSRISTLFSSKDILPWSTSTSFFNSETLLLDFVFVSAFGDSDCLAADFSTFSQYYFIFCCINL